jgi:hypothetical protein
MKPVQFLSGHGDAKKFQYTTLIAKEKDRRITRPSQTIITPLVTAEKQHDVPWENGCN